MGNKLGPSCAQRTKQRKLGGLPTVYLGANTINKLGDCGRSCLMQCEVWQGFACAVYRRTVQTFNGFQELESLENCENDHSWKLLETGTLEGEEVH